MPKEPSNPLLLTTIDDWFESLPPPSVHFSDTWAEERSPLDVWLYDREYMGLNPHRSASGVTLSDKQFGMLEAMDDIDPRTNQKIEFVAEWGKGSGKDFLSALGGLHQTYSLLCLKNPYAYYGLAPNTGFQLVNVAYVKDQAKGVYLNQVKGLLRGSKWFQGKYDIQSTIIKFDHEIEFISAAADGDAVEGKNMYYAVMDEASAFKDTNVVRAMNKAEGQKTEKAADAIYRVLRTSINSRFPGVGKLVIISYPRYINDFTQTKRKENENTTWGWTSGPLATWEVNPRVKKSDFDVDYARNPEMARAMYECDPPFAVDGYIKSPEFYLKAIAAGGKLGLTKPYNEYGQFENTFYGLTARFYAIHIDLGLNKDKCGFAMARQGNPVTVKRCPCNQFNFREAQACIACGRSQDLWLPIERPTCVFTLIKQFAPTEGEKEINFGDIREYVQAIQQRGHKIWALSYDGWQSVDSRQIMDKVLGKRQVRDRWQDPDKKIKEEDIVKLLSVDRNTEVHDTFKEFVMDGRCFIYPDGDPLNDEDPSPVCVGYREWRSLRIQNGKKIDHPLGGSKDVIDAMAGAAYWVAQMPLLRERSPNFMGFKPR